MHLELRFNRDTDGTGALQVTVARGAFSGASEAWFHDREILAFGRALSETFPVPVDQPIGLQGGYWQPDASPPRLAEQLVGLSVHALNASGAMAVRVALKEGSAQGLRDESRASVAVELLTDPESLRCFGLAVVGLVHTHGSVARLDGWV